VLRARALEAPDQPAFIERTGTISFAELDAASAALAATLAARGLLPGARVLLLSPMSIDLYVAVVAVFRLGATVVFVDPSAGNAHLTSCLSRARPDAFIAVGRAHLLRLTSPALRAIPIKLTLHRLVASARNAGTRTRYLEEPMECSSVTPAIITFTSGSTGEPKAAARTHGFLLAQHRALAATLHLEPGGVDLTTLPIVALANLASGVTTIVPDANLRAPGSIDPGPVLDQIRRLRPRSAVASPALLARLTDRGESLPGFDRIHTGGAPVFPCLLDRLARAASGASIVAVYGSTEAEPIAALDRSQITPADRLAMLGGAGLLAGVPSASVTLRILPDRWGQPLEFRDRAGLDRHALGPGLAGEIVVSGDHVLRGYVGGVGDDETKIHAGDAIWHRTGDAGYLDAQGRLWLLGRCSAKVVDACGVAYPFAIECAASGAAGLRRSAFLQHKGQRILAIETAEPRRVREQLVRDLSWAKLADVRMVERIPVDHRHNAKVDYTALAALLPDR
jgi:acyl-CoA synthetase (AMP-forming)/AMP-acid ligase II